MTHEHKFNGTLIQGVGRCACGAWAKYIRKTRTYAPPFGDVYSKGLETQLRKRQDPSIPFPADLVEIPND